MQRALFSRQCACVLHAARLGRQSVLQLSLNTSIVTMLVKNSPIADVINEVPFMWVMAASPEHRAGLRRCLVGEWEPGRGASPWDRERFALALGPPPPPWAGGRTAGAGRVPQGRRLALASALLPTAAPSQEETRRLGRGWQPGLAAAPVAHHGEPLPHWLQALPHGTGKCWQTTGGKGKLWCPVPVPDVHSPATAR